MLHKKIEDNNFIKTEKKEESKSKLQNAYQAPNPYPSHPTGFKILDTVINGITSIPNKIFGQSSSIPILPAQLMAPISIRQDELKQMEMKHPVNIEQKQILTYDKARLDTIEVSYNLPRLKNTYIIKFNGNGSLYEHQLPTLVDDAVRLKATIVAFNYRGVGHSAGTPSSKTRLVTDGIAQVQRILDLGVDPHHIVLDGLSLGGGIATLVAKHFHDKGIRVNLFNDRSFSSISSAATRMIAGELPDSVESSIEMTSYSSVIIADWAINASNAYQTIPNQNKGYMYVADKSSTVDNVGDGVIPHKSSLHEAVKGKRGQGHHYFKMFAPKPLRNGHNAGRRDLVFTDNQELTGQDVFDSFVRRVTR